MFHDLTEVPRCALLSVSRDAEPADTNSIQMGGQRPSEIMKLTDNWFHLDCCRYGGILNVYCIATYTQISSANLC